MSTTTKRQSEPEHPQGSSPAEMSLVEHLAELRSRLIKSCIGIGLGMIISFFFTDNLINALVDLADRPVVALAPTERFSTYLKVSFLGGIAIAMPMLVYQIIAFISPGLTRRERNYVLRAIPFVTLLFVGGLTFAYFIVLPAAIRFLLGFGDIDVTTTPRFSDYISFVSNLLLWVGVSFQMPVIVYTLIKTNIVSAAKLASVRRYVFLLIVVAAAMITPTPDPQNMLLVAGPMYILFELGIVIGRVA